MTSEGPEIDTRNPPVRRSSKKGLKGIIRIFKQDSFKGPGLKLRIPSFREKQRALKQSTSELLLQHEHENLLKEIVSHNFHPSINLP